MASLLGLLEDCMTALSHGHMPSADLLKALISKARPCPSRSAAQNTAHVALRSKAALLFRSKFSGIAPSRCMLHAAGSLHEV